MIKGYGIFVIKPDGIKKKIEKELLFFLQQRNMSIVDSAVKQLTPEQIRANYFFCSNSNIKYLSSSPIKAFFVSSNDCEHQDAIYKAKQDFRSRFGVTKKDFYNLIHSADEGLEFYLQRNLFFPQYASPQYTIGSDMCIAQFALLKSNDRNRLSTSKLLDNSYLVASSIDLLKMKKMSIKYKTVVIPQIYCVRDNIKVEILYYLPYDSSFLCESTITELVQQPNKFKAIPVLGRIKGNHFPLPDQLTEISDPSEYCDMVYFAMRDSLHAILELLPCEIKLRGILIDSPELSLHEVASRYFFSDDFEFMKVSGSINPSAAGLFSVSKCYSDCFYNSFLFEQEIK